MDNPTVVYSLIIPDHTMRNREFYYLRIIICLRKTEFLLKEFQCDAIENLVEHGVHCLPCSYTNDVINMRDVRFDCINSCSLHFYLLWDSTVSMVTKLWCHLTHNSRGA